MLGGGVDAATLVAALGAGPPPPELRIQGIKVVAFTFTGLTRGCDLTTAICRQGESMSVDDAVGIVHAYTARCLGRIASASLVAFRDFGAQVQI